MSDRVLSTGTAREAIMRFQSIVQGDLLSQIQNLNAQGQILSQPDVWDGRLAQEFRSNWPEINSQLLQMQQTLVELREKVQQINQNIMSAGGNA